MSDEIVEKVFAVKFGELPADLQSALGKQPKISVGINGNALVVNIRLEIDEDPVVVFDALMEYLNSNLEVASSEIYTTTKSVGVLDD
jgi:hypothetical protein